MLLYFSQLLSFNTFKCLEGSLRCLDRLVQPENKLTVVIPYAVYSVIHNNQKDFYRSGVSSISFLEQEFETYFVAFSFKPFDPFYEYFNTVMGELDAGGFLNLWNDWLFNPKGLKMKIDRIGPEVLTLDHLMVGFQICLVTATIGVLAFGIEIGVMFFRKPTKKTGLMRKNVQVKKAEKSKLRTQKLQTKNNNFYFMTIFLMEFFFVSEPNHCKPSPKKRATAIKGEVRVGHH